MKKKILSFVSVCLLIASLTTSAFASYNASNVEIEAGSNKTNVTVDALLDFIYSKGGREATDSEMQQISDKIKLNSNGSLSSQTSPAKTIDKYTTYYDNMTKAKTHAYALFDADPFGHEYYGFDSITVQLRAKVGSKTKTFSKDFALAYYRSLSSVPGA